MKLNLSEIRNSIQNGDLGGASEQLLQFTQKHCSRFNNEVMGQQANLKQVLTDERKGIISSETIRLNKNRIVYALLELLDEIDDELTSKGAAKSSKASPEIAKGFHFDGPINHLVIQQSSSGDNVVEKKEKVVEIGKDVQISAPITIADNIENSFNTLAKSSLNDEIKALLEQLLKAINEINKQAAPEHAEVAESMAREAEDLVKEATSAKPRRRWYEVSIEGLKQAATNIGEVATPVLEIVGKLTPLLSGQ